MEERFTALRSVSVIFKVLAWVVGVLGAIGALTSLFIAGAPFAAKIGSFLGVAVVTALNVLFLYAVSELIMLFIAIEHNTYETRQELAKRLPMERAA